MAIKISELISKLKEADQNAEVEFIVIKSDGEVVTADISKQANPIIKFLKMFGG